MHALASYVLVGRIKSQLFPGVDSKKAVRLTNQLLKDLVTHTNTSCRGGKVYTSHSLRSGPATYLEQHRDIKAEHIGERGCWSKRGRDNSTLYRWGTPKTDGAVGRVLSGWRYTDCGGKFPYPNTDIIPEYDQHLFRGYMIELFGYADVSEDVANIFTAVLVMHYKSLSESELRSSIVLDAMMSQSITVSKLCEWSILLKDAFISQNVNHVPRSMLGDLSNQEVIEKLVESNEELRSDYAIQASKTHAKLDRLYELTLQQSSVVAPATSPESSIDAPSVPNLPQQVVVPAIFTPQYYHDQREAYRRSRGLPLDVFGPGNKLNSMDCELVFTNWFLLSYWTLNVPESGAQRQAFNRILKLVAYMKAALPDGTIISPRPSEANADLEWQKDIADLAKVAAFRLRLLCITWNEQTLDNTTLPATTTFSAADRVLSQMPADWFDISAADDQCTDPKFIFSSVKAIGKKIVAGGTKRKRITFQSS